MIIKFLIQLIETLHLQRMLNRIYQSEKVILRLSELFGAQVEKDWWGRLFVVINPAIKDGKLNDDVIYNESDSPDGGWTDEEYVRAWLFSRMNIITEFIKTENLFDALTYRLKKLDDWGNYLLILQPITFSDTIRKARYAGIELLIIVCILIAIKIFLCL